MASAVKFIPLATPNQSLGYDNSSMRGWLERMSLQAGHRLATIAIFATIGSWILVYQGKSDRWATVGAFAASDLGLCIAIFAGLLARWDRRLPSRETIGLFIVNLVLMVLSVQLMLFGRLDLFRNAIEQFFSPS